MSPNDDFSNPKTKNRPDDVREYQKCLQPMGGIGWQRELDGPLGRSVDGFRPTVFELQQVTRYWYRYTWDAQLSESYGGTTSSSELRREVYAWNQLEGISKAIGEEAFNEITDEIDAEIRQQVGEEDWAVITGPDLTEYRLPNIT